MLGFLSQDDLTAELASAKALVAPSLGGESFGMVLTRAFACATPVVASDIPGYRDVMTPETSVAVPPGDPAALADAVAALLEDEPRRVALGAAARQLAIERYSWDDIARRLVADLRVGAAARRAVARVRLAIVRAAAGSGRRCSCRSSPLVGLMLWWRGPDWNVVYHAFDFVNWAWVVLRASCSTSSRCSCASLAWQLTIVQALDPPDPPFNRTFSAFSIGLLGNAVLPGRIGELARVAVLRRRLPHGRGTSAALVGTVFAHRLFDLFPALLLIGYVLATAKIPHWAVTSLIVVAAIGIALLDARRR